jgi:hypothetical protein
MQKLVEIRLTGPRGDNPLGFLTALGAVAALESARIPCLLRWEGLTPVLSWQPPSPPPLASELKLKDGQSQSAQEELTPDQTNLIAHLYSALRREPPSDHAQKRLNQTEKQLKKLRTTIKKKTDEIKKLRLSRDERAQAKAECVEPLRAQERQAESAYISCLSQTVVDPILSLGEDLTVSNERWLAFVKQIKLYDGPLSPLRLLFLVASYGIGNPNRLNDGMTSTPWAMLRGAGHQHFLTTVSELMLSSTPSHLAKAIFGPWIPTDEKLSLRLDPADDRRYALMASDPTSNNNTIRSLWGANRLAFEALQFFPAYPSRYMAVVAWKTEKNEWTSGCQVFWPLWKPDLSPDAIRSLLRLPDLYKDDPSSAQAGIQPDRKTSRRVSHLPSPRQSLQARGVFAVFASTRVRNDKFYNLTPAAVCWMNPYFS